MIDEKEINLAVVKCDICNKDCFAHIHYYDNEMVWKICCLNCVKEKGINIG